MAPMLRGIAVRSGFGALGTIYVALGIVTARVALLGARRREEGIPGALRLLLAQPKGNWILGAVVIALGAIAAVRLFEAATGSRTPLARVGLGVSGIGYAAFAWTAGRLLLHLGRGGGSIQKTGLSWLFGESWGPAVVEIAGVAVAAGGVWELYQGVRGRLPFRRDLLPKRFVRLLSGLARFGLVARGLVLCVLGYFLIRAAEELDPGRARSMGGALRVFSTTALGPVFTAVVALGLAAYGVYLWTLALLKRRV
jgi:hypothetical protein